MSARPARAALLAALDTPDLPAARCRDSVFGPDLWFSGDPGDMATAAAVCRACPARAPCELWARRHRERWGTWGGYYFGGHGRPAKIRPGRSLIGEGPAGAAARPPRTASDTAAGGPATHR